MSGTQEVEPRPTIRQPAVLDALRRAYGLPFERLTFAAIGWASYGYRAETVSGEIYWLKLYDGSVPAPLVAGSQDFYLPLTHELCTRRLLPQIACPLRAKDGGFLVRAGSYLLILFHFIDGELIGFRPLPDDVLVKLAGLVGRLHRSTPDLDLVNPLIEDFRIAFEDALPAGLEALAARGPSGSASWRGFQDLLLPRRSEMRGYLDRLKELQGVMRARPREMVVCHTDLHGGNLLVDSSGNLYILDWENAMLAPPEHDLFFFAGEEAFWDLFWPNYQREFGPAQLDVDALAFYYYRRGLEDLAEWIQRLLHSGMEQERDREALHWATETVADLGNVETKVASIEGRL